MTMTVTSLTAAALLSNTYDALSSTIGLIVIGALAVLLLMRELAPILRHGNASREIRALDMALVPLLLVFAVVVISRFAELLK